MTEEQNGDRPIIGRDERERAHDAAEIRPPASGAPGEQGNESATNRQDTQATTDAEELEPVAEGANQAADQQYPIGSGGQTVDEAGNPVAAGQQGGGPGSVGLGTPSQAEGERGATDVEAAEGIEPEPRR